MNITEFDEPVYDVVRSVPEGKVVRYGDIAKAIGKKCSRAVGNSLHKNPYFGDVPCHRVVSGEGKLAEKFAFDGISKQQKMLEKEGVEVIDGKVDLKKYLFEL